MTPQQHVDKAMKYARRASIASWVALAFAAVAVVTVTGKIFGWWR